MFGAVLFDLLGIDRKNMSSRLRKITNELHESVKDTGFILAVLDSVSPLNFRALEPEIW